MRRPTVLTALVVLAALPVMPSASGAQTQVDQPEARNAVYARVDLARSSEADIETLRQAPETVWWVELGDSMLVLAEDQALGRLLPPGTAETLNVEPRAHRLHIVRGARLDDLRVMDVDVLAHGGRHAVIQARSDRRPTLPAHDHGPAMKSHQAHAELVPFEPDLVLTRAHRAGSARRLSTTTQAWSAAVDGQRWYNDVSTLAGYNRYTHGTEIHDARDWLVAQFQALPGLTVTTPSFQVQGTTAYNVIATWTGSERPDELFVVGAHYDAISPNPGTAAPGAEDNASGCAGVLELARVLTARSPAASVLFICYSGEEQGLFGGIDHAAGLVSQGLDDNVRLALNMDMIGYTGDADLDCLLETSTTHSALLDTFTAAAAGTSLRILTSLFPFGSDHVPYLDRGMPGVLTIQNDWDSYGCYHETCDLANQVSLEMGREILKMNAAVLAEMIGEGGVIFRDGFESGNLSAWASQ